MGSFHFFEKGGFLIVALLLSACSYAQSYNPTSAATMTGAPPYSTHDILREDVALASGGLHVYIPIFSLKGKGGQTFGLGWAADSHSINLQEFDQPNGWNTPQTGALNPYVYADWVVSPDIYGYVTIPHLRASWQFFGDYCDLVAEACNNYPLFCNANFTFRDESGTTYSFSKSAAGTYPVARDCTNTGQTGAQALYTNPIGDSDESPGVRLDTSNPNDIIIRAKDGSVYHFPAVATFGLTENLNYYDYNFVKIVDPNGNTITDSGGTITDSTGRTIIAGNNSVTWTDSNGNRQIFSAALGGPPGPVVSTNSTGCNFINPYQSQHQGQYLYNGTDIANVGNYANGVTLMFPGGTAYALQFDQVGKITKITYPGGGYTRYDYQDQDPEFHLANLTCYAADYWEVSAKHVCSSTSGSCSQSTEVTTTYAPGPSPIDGVNGYTDVTDPLNNRTHYVFNEVNPSGGIASNPRETERDIYQGQSTLVKVIQTAWTTTADNALPNRVTTILKDVTPNLTSHVSTTYDTPQGSTVVIDNPLEVDEYDFDGTLKRKANYVWQKGGNYTVATGHILDRPLSETVTDPATGHVSTKTYVNDTVGNLKSVTAGGTNATSLTTSYTRNTFGDATLITDPAGNNTNVCYDGGATCPNSSTTDLYGLPTAMADTLGHLWLYTYFATTGLLNSSEDPNSQTTTYLYDALGRMAQVSYPDGGGITNTYLDTAPLSVTTTTKITSTLSETTEVLLDGLGRQIQTQLTSDPSGTDFTDTTYDALERVSSVSNPHRSTSATSDGTTTYVYDGIGRLCVTVPSDGTVVSACPATAPVGDVLTAYAGNCTTITDEAGKTRKSCVDGLGRITGVWEDPTVSNYETDYLYDGFNNLTSVTQIGAAASGSWRSRAFVYDGLSRLTSATNPESGTIIYSYAKTGGGVCAANEAAVCIKIAPSPNQAATGTAKVTTTYTYDALSRLTSKSYSDAYTPNAPTPSLSFGYDGVAPSGCTPPTVTSPTGSGLPISPLNTIGRRSAMCDGSGAAAWIYDSMGRPTIEERKINAVTKNTGYAYFLNGQMSHLWYPSGNKMNFFVTGAGIANGVEDSFNNYVPLNATFAPNGALASMVQYTRSGSNVAGFVTNYQYNKRFQPALAYSAYTGSGGTVYLYQHCFDYHQGGGLNITYGGITCSSSVTSPGNNGNVYQIVNKLDDTRTQNFSYDSLNRIQQAYTNGSNWGQQFNIDAWGNLASVAGVTGKAPVGVFTSPVTKKNQLSAYSYDAAGNMLSDGSGAITYDAENRISATAGVTYTYDGDGKRVEKSSGTLYWTGEGADTLAESDLTGNINEEYVFFNSMRVSRIDRPSGTVHGFVADHLGSSRIMVTPFGTNALHVDQDLDYTPYGIVATGTVGDHYEFTGKERDSESSLDYFGARHYASTMGRWMSPDLVNVTEDRVVNPANTLNKYVYGGNNPLKYVDPDGRDITYFYDQGGIAGHAILFAYNQATGDSAIESFGPAYKFPIAPGVSMFEMNTFTSADDLRDKLTSLTIQTTPELAQQVIDYIRANPDPALWVYAGPNCSSQVWKVLQKFKLAQKDSRLDGRPGNTPRNLWGNLIQQNNPFRQGLNPKNGIDYGNNRFDMFNLMWLSLPQSQPKATVTTTTTNCVTDADGKKTCKTF